MDPEPSPPAVRMTTEITAGERKWAELPWDALSVVFEKVGLFDVFVSAQAVCSQWWKLSHDPRVWRRIEFLKFTDDTGICYDFAKIALAGVNRSNGSLVEFSIAECGTDDHLKRISETTTQLKVLRLIYCDDVSDKGLIKACKNFSLLEELEISYCGSLTSDPLEFVGHSCPGLKKFRLNCIGVRYPDSKCNKIALAIAKYMPELRELQLVGNRLDNSGLRALLDGCCYLESLDIRQCFQLNLGEDLKRRCQGMRFLRLPKDSIEDYPYEHDYMGSEFDTDNDYNEYGFDDHGIYEDFFADFDYNFDRVPGVFDVADMLPYMFFQPEEDDAFGADYDF